MVISLRKWIRWSKILLIFVLGTYLLYHFLDWMALRFFPYTPHPDNGAIPVITYKEQAQEEMVEEIRTRLVQFYWLGE
jgi:hypothetical protein